MRISLIILSFICCFSVIGQIPTCQHTKQHQHELTVLSEDNYKALKTGDEQLRSDTVNVLHYSIYLDFTNADLGTLSGNCEVKFSPLLNTNTISLDLLTFTVDSVVMHGNQIAYSYNDTLLVANFGSTINAGQTDSITVYYHGTPPTDPSGWGGFYMSGGYYYNLGVGFASYPHNFGRAWHPCFDNFVERATYSFSILTDNTDAAYCNGTLENLQAVTGSSNLASWEMHTAIPSYLASVAVAPYTHVEQNYYSALQSQNFPIWLAAKPADTTNLKLSFQHLQDALEGFENFYGPYNWERVGYVLVPFNSGAMEHATNIAYPLATANGSLTYETLMAHELSHHWWGDWVTCETAEEMWINEGMAKYSEHLFTEWVYDYDSYMDLVRDNHYGVLHMAHISDSGYYALNAVPQKYTYGMHSYDKGADVLHTMRSYMGDANFYAALKSVQTTYGGGTISSIEFMTHLNSLGYNVSDFFNAWIFQPGFAHFSVANFSVTPSGSSYNVEVLVDQKLKGGADYHANVPLQLTFMSATQEVHTENIIMPAGYEVFNFVLPFEPQFVGVNLDERINDATTAVHQTITSPSNYLWNYANIRVEVDAVQDSAFLRVEHNWVYPDVMGVPDGIQISMDRYWNIHGVNLDNVEGTLRFDYNAKPIPSGNLDNGLMVDLGGQPFIEDSLVLLYRPNAQANWQVHSDYTISYTGSHSDKAGYITANQFAPGQYTFGYKTNSVGLPQQVFSDKRYSIYPNPASDSMVIDLTSWESQNLIAEVVAMEGKLIGQYAILGGQKNTLSVSNYESGPYLVLIKNGNGQTLGAVRVLVR